MLAWLLACQPDHDPAHRGGRDPFLAPPDTDPPAFDQGAVEVGLADVIDLVPTLSAEPALQAYDKLRAMGDDRCPPSYPYSGYEYWYAECTADSGAVFTGYAYSYLYGYPQGSYRGLYIYGSVVDPRGRTLAATGAFADTAYTHVRTVKLDGVFTWSGADVDGTWIARGITPSLKTTRERHQDRRQLTIDGGLAGLGDDPDTVEFDQVAYDTADHCAEPTGAISVRVAGGSWFDLAFGDDCDGCGDATYQGLPVGEACADFSPWATWEDP